MDDVVRKKSVLVISPHTDDADVGAGGTLIRWGKTTRFNMMHIALSDCMDIARNRGFDLASEFKSAQGFLNTKLRLYNFHNRRFHEQDFDIRELLEELKKELTPDIVFCPSSCDIHQDHQTVYAEAFRVFRNNTILGYESPRSSIGFRPDLYVVLNADIAAEKCQLVGLYKSQQSEYYMKPDNIKALLMHRGAECGRSFAEGFEVIRGVIE